MGQMTLRGKVRGTQCHQLTFRETPVRCVVCGQAVGSVEEWLTELCGGSPTEHEEPAVTDLDHPVAFMPY